jgi:hypothetical protein
MLGSTFNICERVHRKLFVRVCLLAWTQRATKPNNENGMHVRGISLASSSSCLSQSLIPAPIVFAHFLCVFIVVVIEFLRKTPLIP